MHRSTTPDADALLAATTRLEHVAGQTGSPRQIAASLVQVEAALRALDRTCLAAAAALIPPPEPHGDICASYRAAAAQWDTDTAPPSYERQAQILASLHDAGATLRAAAECCHRARALIESTYEDRQAPMLDIRAR